MKQLLIKSALFAVLIFTATSCKKYTNYLQPAKITTNRDIQFLLYTDKDFSNNTDNIRFSLSIQNSEGISLWDSVLVSPMKIKDIPDFAHKLTIVKTIPVSDNSILKVGFRYTIEDVGNSWYYDSSSAGQTFKSVAFNFQ